MSPQSHMMNIDFARKIPLADGPISSITMAQFGQSCLNPLSLIILKNSDFKNAGIDFRNMEDSS